jgi:tetratricopeptide (TPR) repeat protein
VRRIGRYQVGRRIGEGATGEVFEAQLLGPAGFRKAVALKLLTDRELAARQARLAGRLRHPNIVGIYDVGEVDGTWYLALEHAPGGSLAERIPLPPLAVVQVGLQVCAALVFARAELGLAHLDLKPANLLLDDVGQVKLADFDAAETPGEAPSLRGTPRYAAPEQHRDHRSDLYSLGLVLTELATGDIVAPPSWLAAVVDRCVQADPSQRFTDATALAVALESLEVGGEGLGVVGPRLVPPSDTMSFHDPLESVPVDEDTFVGRESERSALSAALDHPGVVVVKGLGGIGKSRLAREVLRQTGRAAWYVPVAGVGDADFVVAAVGNALGVERPNAQRVGFALAEQRGVLVLDAVEGRRLGPLLDQWVEQAPELVVLATSRRPTGARAERVIDLDRLSGDAAVALLAERSELSPDLLVPLAARLDGHPLSLELAAARLRMMGPEQLTRRLDERLRLLTSGGRSIRATLDLSWDLLTDAHRDALCCLCVFVGPVGLDAARDVLGAQAFDLVDALLRDSWLAGHEGRVRSYELVRAYVRELADAEVLTEARRRHLRWFASPGRLEPDDVEDAVAACSFGIDDGKASLAANVLERVQGLLSARGDARRVAALAERLLTTDLPSAGRREVELTLAVADLDLGRAARTLERLPRSTDPAVAAARVAAWNHLGRGDAAVEEAREALDEAPAGVNVLRLRNTLAIALRARGDHREAAVVFARVAADGDRLGSEVGTAARMNLANTLRDLGDVAGARAQFERVARRHGRARTRAAYIARVNHAGLLRDLGEADRARDLLEEAEAFFRAQGHVRTAARTRYQRALLPDEDTKGHLRAVIADAQRVDDHHLEGIALGDLGGALRSEGRLDEASEVLQAARGLLEELGARDLLMVRLNLALCARDAGDVDAAEVQLGAVAADAREVGAMVWAAVADGERAGILIARGHEDEARQVLREVVGVLEGRHREAHAVFAALLEPLIRVDGGTG